MFNVYKKIETFLAHLCSHVSANIHLRYVNCAHPCTKNNEFFIYLSLTFLFFNNCTQMLNPNVFNKILLLSVMF